MKHNVATLDRLLRAVVVAPALVLGAYALDFGTAGGIVLIVVAVVMLATAAIGSCPLYALLHIDTRHLRRSTAKAAAPAHR